MPGKSWFQINPGKNFEKRGKTTMSMSTNQKWETIRTRLLSPKNTSKKQQDFVWQCHPVTLELTRVPAPKNPKPKPSHSPNYEYYTQILMPSVQRNETRQWKLGRIAAKYHPEIVISGPADRGHFGGPNNP